MKLHIDTDIGSNIDDVCALALVLASAGAELTGITTVVDQGGKRAGYAKHVLELAGRDDGVAVAAGAAAASGRLRAAPPLQEELRYWGQRVPPAPGPLEMALDLLATSIERGATIAAIGPCTNLALLEERAPGILSRARLVLMGGYVFPPRAGLPPIDAARDSNFQNDPEAAAVVLQAARQPVIVPIAVTIETALRRAHLAALAEAGRLPRLIARQGEAFAADHQYERLYGATCPALPADIVAFHHDPLTCAVALGRTDGINLEPLRLKLDIADGRLHQTEHARGLPVTVVTGVNGAQFSRDWLATVTRSFPA